MEDLQQENDALKAKIHELTRRLAEQDARLEEAMARMQQQARVLDATLDSIADGVIVWNTAARPLHVNRAVKDMIEAPRPERRFEDVSNVYGLYCADGVTPFPPEALPLTRALRGEHVEGVEVVVRNARRPDGARTVVTANPISMADGTTVGAVQVFRDITEQTRTEERRRAAEEERERLLGRLESAVQELSTPILEVWDDVLVLPVIGVVDARRSTEMMERLLQAVERKQCRHVILDITGVEVIDAGIAQQLVDLVTAVEYLGARCVLTGTRAAVAQTLVSLGLDLGPRITMLRTLKHGLRECMRRTRASAA